ncbi:hemagglutinin repeat-containing protein [Vibrio sp. LaRot3]|nr:hemagglutinin repeat-containing protein [Vibrio sp. LaRot3]
MANVVAHDTNTIVTKAPNGVDVVNIAQPNQKGLSHNKFDKYNVDKSGLILNNSVDQFAVSELGGVVEANGQLQGRAADVILNEVVKANRSQLEGYTEVLGQQANVIIANSYGITCDGCGFINTPRVSLVTGKPEFAAGQVSGFDVSQGSVVVQGQGLDASRQSYFDIIAHTAKVTADIHAQDLAIVVGNNRVKYQTNQVEQRTPTDEQATPTVAIDTASLGGMYAGRITLVSTQEGVGVNVGNLATSQGDLTINAAGQVVLGKVKSEQDIQVASGQAIKAHDLQLAKGKANFQADDIAFEETKVAAEQGVAITAARLQVNSSEIHAGTENPTDSIANLNVSVDQLHVASSVVSAEDTLVIQAQNLASDAQSQISADNITIEQLNQLTNDGKLSAKNTLLVQGEQLSITGSGSIAADTAELNGNQQLQVDSQLVTKTKLTLKTQGELQTGAHADLTSHEQAQVNAQRLVHSGKLVAQQTQVDADELELTSSSKLSANDALDVQSDTITNTGQLSAGQQVRLTGTRLVNRGSIESQQDIVINHATVDNHSEIKAAHDIALQASQVTQTGQLEAGNQIELTASGKVDNQGKVIAGQQLALQANALVNSGELSSQDVRVVASNLHNQATGLITGSQSTVLQVGEVHNEGTLQALNDLGLTVNNLNNVGALIALNDMTVEANSKLTNSGVIYAGRDGALYALDTLSNQQGDILTGRDLVIAGDAEGKRSQRVENVSGSIEAGAGLSIAAEHIENKRLAVSSSSSTQTHSSVPSAIKLSVNLKSGGCRPAHGSGGLDGGAEDQQICSYTYDAKTATKHYKTEIVRAIVQGDPAKLLANGSLLINAQNLDNQASLIAANSDAVINVNSLNNEGYVDKIVKSYARYQSNSGSYIEHTSFGASDKTTEVTARLSGTNTSTTTNGSYSSTIKAAGNLQINASNQVNNSVLTGNAGKYATDATTQQPKQHTAATIDRDGIELPGQNSVAFPEYKIPSAPNGLFVISDKPEGRYLIETNPHLSDIGNFLGSDYFLSKIDFDPEKDVTFLGDAFYDTRVITQAIFEQTGQRYLNDAVGNDLEQMQHLIDNAAQVSGDLKLSFGVGLTEQQIANLTSDIVWWEEIEVDGKTVLAPKLYLAKTTRDNVTNGALIAGKQVDINAGNVVNQHAQIQANNGLNIVSAQEIVNDNGSLTSHGSLTLQAQQDIKNIGGDIRGQDVKLVSESGSVINQTVVEQQVLFDGQNYGMHEKVVNTLVGNNAGIVASGTLAIDAGQNIINDSATIASQGDAALIAGNDIQFDSKAVVTEIQGKTRFGHQHEKSVEHLQGQVSSGGKLSMIADGDIRAKATQIAASDDVLLSADNVTIETALNEEYLASQDGRTQDKSHSKRHQGSSIAGNNVTIDASGDVKLIGSSVEASNDIAIAAKGDVDVLAVNDSDYRYHQSTNKKSFGRSSTTTKESYHETVNSADLSGNNISISANRIKGKQLAGGDSDITLVGANLNAEQSVNLNADGDIVLAAQQYKQFDREQTVKKGFAGLSGSDKGSVREATLLDSANVITGADVNFNSGNDIGVIASNVVSGGNVNLEALDQVLLSAGEELKKAQEWSEKTSFLTGGSLFEMEKKRSGVQEQTAKASTIQAAGNLTVDTGSVKVVGSQLEAGENIDLSADTGSVEILTAKESREEFSSEETLKVKLNADVLTGLSVENGQVKYTIGEATYDKVDEQSQSQTNKGSQLLAGNNLTIDAESNILVEGSELHANADQSGQGDMSLAAKDNVTIKEAKDTHASQTEEVHGKAEVSLVVKHQAVELAKSAQALKDSKDKLEKANSDYKQYKKQITELETTLATLKQEFADKAPGVSRDDIIELESLIGEVKSDEAWFIADITMATADVASKTTALIKQSAATYQSASTYGFNAGLNIDLEASKTNSSSEHTSSLASNLSGQNVTIRSGNNDNNTLTVQGSNVSAEQALALSGNEVNILASQDTSRNETDSKSGSVNISMSIHESTFGGPSINASFNENKQRSNSTTHTNSQLNGDQVTISSMQDTNIKGGNVYGDSSTQLTVGGDLNLASVQDNHNANNKGQGFSAGISTDAGNVVGGNGGVNFSKGRSRTTETVVSSITSNGELEIDVAGNTDITGAKIAALDEQGNDSGQLKLSTGSLTFADLSNSHYEQSKNGGLSTNFSVVNEPSKPGENAGETPSKSLDFTNSTTSVQYANNSNISKSKTLATVGQGQLEIGDKQSDIERLNRDVTNTEKELYSVNRQQGNIDATLDHRIVTEEGRAGIKEDIKRTDLGNKSLLDVLTEDSVTLDDTFEHIDVVQKEFDVLKQVALTNPEAAQILNNLDSADPEAKQYAAEVYVQTYAQVMGITIEEARVVAFSDTAKGNHIAQGDKTIVELNDAETTNGGDASNTLIHEGTHAAISQGRIGEKGEYEEQYAGLVGNYAEDSFKFVLENYGLGEYKSGDVNQHIGNDSSPLIWLNNVNSAIQHNTPGVTVDNRFLSKREYELANTLAAESNGKYTAEEIRNAMRHTKAQESEKYDSGVSPYFVDTSKVDDKSFVDTSEGKLIVAQDGTGKGRYIVQDIRSIPLDESAKQYLLDQDLGFSFFDVPETKVIEIEFLTGNPINSQNGTYQVSHIIDGKSYVVDYHSCATPECVATNSNMVKNAASEAFIDATSAKALDDASTLANGALLLTPYGTASNVRHVQHLDKIKVVGEVLNQGTSFGSAYLNGEIGKFVTEEAFSRTLGKMLVETLGKGKGEKVNVYIDTLGIGDIGEVLPEDKAIEEEFKSYVQGATE